MSDSVKGQHQTLMRWFCGVPVLANPLMLIDLLSSSVILWFVTVLMVVGAQALLGDGPLLNSHIAAACLWASYVSALLPLLFIGVCLIFYRGGTVVLYSLEENGVFMETMRNPQTGRLFSMRPFAVDPPDNPPRTVPRNVDWSDVRGVRELAEMRVLKLRGRWGTLLTLYCPDHTVYEQALEIIQKKAVRS